MAASLESSLSRFTRILLGDVLNYLVTTSSIHAVVHEIWLVDGHTLRPHHKMICLVYVYYDLLGTTTRYCCNK